MNDKRQVYFIRNDLTGNVKIGVAMNPEKRLSELQTGSDGSLELIRIEEGGVSRESELHRQFEDYRIRGEWFRPSNELNEYLSGKSNQVGQSTPSCDGWSERTYRIMNRRTDYVWPPRRLALMPEPNYLACLCDWGPEDGCPIEFYAEELRRAFRKKPEMRERGWVPIYWGVCVEDNGTWCPPFLNPDAPWMSERHTWHAQDFSTPLDSDMAEPVDWYSLPIRHRFPEFWKAIGFDPAPFQTRFDLRPVLARGGLKCRRG